MDNKELVEIVNNKVVTTSKQVAKVFGKEHSKVIRSIEGKIARAKNGLSDMYAIGSYKDASGKENKMYYMNRDGLMFLAFSFTGKKVDELKLAYINAFNTMEKKLKEQQNQVAIPSYQIDDPVKRAERWIEEEKERQRLANNNQKKTKYITDNKERTKLGKAIEHTKGNITIGSLAKILKGNGINIGQNRLFKWMRNNGYLISKKGRNFNDPTQKINGIETV